MSAIPRDQVEDMHALSPVQQGMFFHALLEPELAPYVTQGLWRLQGRVAPALFARAWQELVARHPVLRSVFRQARRQPVQIVLASQPIDLSLHDWTSRSPDDQRAALSELARAARAPFRLADGPLFRLSLVQLGPEEWRLLWTFHHIILDGLSVGLLLDGLCRAYDTLAAGEPLPAAEVAPFGRFMGWLAQQDRDEAIRFWSSQLDGVRAPTALPYDRRPTSVAGRSHRARHAWIDRDTSRALGALARRHRVTLARIVHAAWALLLARHSGEPEIVFGVTLAGRPTDLPDIERIAGPFINTVPVRVSLTDDPPLADLLRTLQRQFFDIEPYSYVSLADIQGCTPITAPAKLFDSAINVHPPVDWNGFRTRTFTLGVASEEGPPLGRTNYDLMADVVLFDTIGVTLSYVEEVFDAETIDAWLECFTTLLASIAAHGGEARVSALAMVSPRMRTRLVASFNHLDTDAVAVPAFDGGIVSRIEAQAAAADAIAVVGPDETLRYGALNARANRLAAWLRSSGIGREDRVAILGERGAGLIAAMLGILKAGAAFVPLDPLLPDARLAAILAASQARLLLCGPESAARARALAADTSGSPRTVCWTAAPAGVAMEDVRAWSEAPDGNPAHVTGPRDLACVFFTSGSTGRPKGAMVEHGGLLNHHAAKVAAFGIGPGSVVAQNAALGFDICVWQMLAALEAGGRVVVYDDDLAIDAERLVAALARDGVTLLETVPTLLEPILDATRRIELPALRLLISNAELLPVPLCRDWLARHPRVPIVNTYGATECSDDTTHHVQEAPPPDEMLRVPVGRPIPGARLYTIDRDLRPVPYGGAGEIATGGVAVGRGYLDDPIATALAFVPDPFASEPGARLYRSGDIGRWTRDGVLEFLGRDDDQVKVRGHRIELGEIQAALLRCDGVRQAAVVIGERAPGEPQCFAYWVGDAAAAIDAASLRETLAASLPAYMVPAAFVRLDALPITPNGKVDRRALPLPSADDRSTAYVAPHEGDEAAIAEIWRAVLDVARVGATDNFFELGGQSLKTLQIRLRLAQTFGLEVPMRAVFRHQTVRAQARLVADLRCAAARPSAARLPRLPEAASYALSRAQRRLWLVQQLDPGDTSYNLLEPLTLDGALDLPAFERAWSSLVARHESLRTTFVEIDGEPRQRIAQAAPIRLPHIDLAGADDAAREEAVRRLLAEARDTPFALDAPLVRALVITLAPERHLFAVALHHLVSDAWSGDVLLRDFLALYRAARLGEEAALAPLPARYIDYAAWQTERLASGGHADDEAFWLDTLRGELPAIAPALASAPAAASEAEGEAASTHVRTFVLDAGTAARVRRAAAGRDLTPFMLRLALLKAALARLAGLEDLLVGAPVAGRDHPDVEALVGFFVNLLAFRTGIDGGAPFTDLLDRVGASCVEAYAHQDYPFDALVQRLNPARATGRVPIFDVLFTTFASGQAREAGGLTIAESASRRDGAAMVWPGANMAVALFAICREEPDGALAWALVFDAQRFDRASAASVARRIETVMRAVADRPDAPLSSIETLTPAERDRITHAWNATATPYPRDETVHALVERQVARAPEAIAVIDGDRRWTYRAINTRANQLARQLIARGLEPGALAGTLLDRSADLVIAQLAILKTGAAYLSLSPDDPPARTRFMLENGRVALVVSARAFDDLARDLSTVGWVRLDRDGPAIAAQAEENLPPRGDGGSLSHVMYTSGSTGRPKGAMLTHRGITRLLCENPELRIGPDDRLAQMASCLFDGVTLEIWGALLNGARLVILARETVLSPPSLSEAFETHGITVATLTPVLFNQMARETPRAFRGLRHLFSGGDVMSAAAARRVREESAPARLSNGYGPTENSMFTTCHLVTPADDAAPVMPVGRPVANTQVYIVDTDLRLVGAGVAGELLTGGDGLGQGYWDRPELTAAQFVPDPFGAASGARLYRTGDLARWREDGAIEFLGRVDHQVKIRGHRIELGEVEALLMEHPAIAAAAVTLRTADDGDRQLAAYVVAAAGATLQAGDVRQFASGRLPAYMVPAWIVLMPALPLTAGRKVDRQALPAPADDRAVCGAAYVAPRDGVEQAIAAAWGELLGRSAIGVHDNFFEIGGHSLTTVRLRSRLSERFAIDLPLRAVFEHQTIEAQAQAVAARVAAGTRPAPARVPRLPDREHYPLSHAQRRLWFLQRLHPGDTTYTVFAPIVLDGPLDAAALTRAFDALIARHASLRTSFDLVGSEPVQRISETFRPDLERYDLCALDADTRRARALAIAKEMGETAFDLTTPPIRAALLSLTSARHVLFLALHHGITDGWSWRLLVDDLGAAYRAARAGETPDLPPLALRYVDYAAWQQARLESGALADAEQYWQNRLRDAPPDLVLSDEPPDDEGAPDAMRTVLAASGAQAAEAIRRLGQAQGATPLMVRLALLAAFLARASGQDDLIVGTAVSGRDHADAESIVGFFVNILPIRIRLDGDPTFVELLDRVRRICLDAFAHQDYPFDLMVQRLNPSRRPDQLPFVQILFTSDAASAPTPAGDVSIGGIERLPGSVSLEGGWSGSANGLRITCVEQGAGLAWNLAYPARRLRTDAARRLVRQFAGFIEDVTQAPAARLSAIDLRAECTLSAAQREVWRECERHPAAPVAAASLQVVLRGPLDAGRWQAALQAALDRHDALRAAFHTAAAGAVVQQIAPRARLDLPLVDLSSVEIGGQARALEAIAQALAGEAFDLAAPPLVRARLVRTAADAHVCLLAAHRLVIDPHDLPRLAREALQSYAQPAAAPATPDLQYADFVSWQDGRLRGGAFARQAQALRRLLQPPPPDASWPVSRPMPAVRTFEAAQCRRTIAPALLHALARPGGASVEASVVAMFAALVGRLTGQTDLLAGLRLSSAPKAFEPLLGTFAQRLPLRIAIDDRQTFADLARDVEARLADLQSRRETPGALAQADEPWPDPPAFAVAVERIALAASAAGDLHLQADLPVAASGSEMLTLVLVSTGDGLDLALRYPAELFDAETVRCWTEALVSGLSDAAVRPEAAVGALDLLGEADRDWLVRTVNATAAPLSAGATVHALVDAQAARRPEAIAVIDGRARWTYGQLTTQANRLARHLLSRGVEPGTLVATVLERSAALVIAQLAILKAGAAYLPLHPEDPRERLAFMLADGRVRCAIADGRTQAAVDWPSEGLTLIDLDRDAAAIAACPDAALPPRGHADSLAYVTYTSGSTGRPKGAMIPHRGIVRLVCGTRCVPIGSEDVLPYAANVSFDAATFEVWGALANGARLVICPHEMVLSPAALLETFATQGVTIAFLTAALFHQIVRERPSAFARLCHLVTGGDVVGPRAARQVLEQGAPGQLWNAYGPTENTTFTTVAPITIERTSLPTLPIGRPIANTTVYVVDRELRPVAIGITGELCTGGAGLADGYWDRPALTAGHFVPDPFSDTPGARLYCTGDAARWRADGTIEFVGRIDQQVKIHGRRVEPGEIEAVLCRHATVANAVVIVRDRGDGLKTLAAYVVPAPGAVVAADLLRRHVAASLPAYMVPAWIVPLAAFPLTPTGKVDRRALPPPEPARPADAAAGAEPRTPLARAIAEVWKEALHVDRVGLDDNFFDLGGDSVLCIVAVSHLAERGIHTTPKELYAHATVAALAEVVGQAARAARGPERAVSGAVPLLPIQRFFFELGLEQSHHWNAGTLMRAERLDIVALRTALQALLDRHDALRMRFANGPDGWTQHNPPPGEAIRIEEVDLRDAAARLTSECTRVQASLDYVNGPIFRAALFRLPDGTDRLLLVAHHLVSDMVSGRIIYEDLQRAYDQAVRGEPVVLPARTTSFQHWGELLLAHAPSRLHELPYWQAIADGIVPSMPVDHDLGDNTMETVAHVQVELDAETTRTLLTRARPAFGVEMHDLLIAALARTLGAWNGQAALPFLVEGHGREDIFDGVDLTRTVGWFTAMYPVRLETGRGRDLAAHIHRVRDTLRDVPDRGLAYGLLRFLLRRPELAGPLPEVSFNYHGQFSVAPAARFGVAQESAGVYTGTRGRRFSLLNVECWVGSGCLRAAILYSQNKHRAETLTAVLRQFLDELRATADVSLEGAAETELAGRSAESRETLAAEV